MAKRAAVVGASPTGKKSLRRLKEARMAQYKAERKVGKLRVRLERAESKLARRARALSEIETQVAQQIPEAKSKVAATASAPTLTAGKQGRAKRGKKTATAQAEEQRLEAIGLSAPVHGDTVGAGAVSGHGQNSKGEHGAAPTIVLPDELASEEQDAE